MRRWRMSYRVISKALRFRPGKVSASIGALTVGATLVSAFLSLYFVLPGKMSGEFRALGPNLIVAPRGNDQTFSDDLYNRLISRQPQAIALPWLYAVGQAANKGVGSAVVLGGTDLARLASMNPGWKVLAGDSTQSLEAFLKGKQQGLGEQGWLLAGEKAAAHFGWNVGQTVEVTYGGRAIRLPLEAVVSTGGSEDSQALLPISALQALTTQTGKLSLIQARLPGSAAQVESRRGEIAALLPEAEARPLRQVVESEARVVMKVRALMYGLTAVVLGIVILSVMTTVSGVVLDRQRDIGIMKTLGASEFMISFLFVAETAVCALAAAVLGYWLGFGLAEWASVGIFHSALPWRGDVLASVVAVTIAVALAATAFPIHLVRKMEPAVILKGN
jgi:putative ABC transport system permease protein